MDDSANALPPASALVATGTAGLDEVLGGGLPANRLYLLEGDPGSGKTTLALQFLMDGVAQGEPALYVTLSESRDELLAVAASHGWSLDGITICELTATEESLNPETQNTVFEPAELELGETLFRVMEEVDRVKPRRLVFDSLSEVRLLAQSSLRYRRQTLGLKQYLTGRNCTVVLIDDRTSEPGDLQLHSIAHGVVTLEQLVPEFGGARRRLRISKLRGRDFRGGYHDFKILRGGITVFPRLVAAEHRESRQLGQLPSGVPEIDSLLYGGVDRGNSTLILGPAGAGKSTVALQFVYAAAQRGEHSVIYAFDESIPTLLSRTRGLGMHLEPFVESGLIRIQRIDPAELTPGEFAELVCGAADGDGSHPASIVVIDSLNGYLQSMPEERFLVIQLHELLSYLGQKGVSTFVLVAQHGLMGAMISPIDATYLADTVVLLRYFEAKGAVRKALSVVKRRGGPHEPTIREIEFGSKGITVGPPLDQFQGVLTGTPTFTSSALDPRIPADG